MGWAGDCFFDSCQRLASKRWRLPGALGLCLLLAAPQAAQALGADAWNTGFIIDFNEKWLRDDAVNRALSQARKDMKPRARRSGGDPNFKTDILWTGRQVVVNGEFVDEGPVRKLAGMFPPAQRSAGVAMFTQVIAAFNDNVERLYQVPAENLATGVGALLAGGYAAYHQKPFPDAWVRPMVEQMGDVLRQRPELFKDRTAYKLEAYQIGVGIGMLLMTAQAELAQKPDAAQAAQLKAAGAQVLQSVLGASPERIEFSSAGVRVR